MAAFAVKLRCTSWEQLSAIYERDLKRGGFFLPVAPDKLPLGTAVHIGMTIPSGSLLNFRGQVSRHVSAGEVRGKAGGIDVKLDTIAKATLWIIESALAANAKVKQAGATPSRPGSDDSAPPVQVPLSGSEPVDDRETAAAQFDLVEALTAERNAFVAMGPHQILGVARDSTEDQVRVAFAYLSKKYHPDHIAQFESDAARSLATEIFMLLKDAYGAVSTGWTASAAPRAGAKPPAVPSTVRAPRPVTSPPTPASSSAPPARPQAARSKLSEEFLFGDLGDLPEDGAPAPTEDPIAGYSEADRLLDAGEYEQAIAAFDRRVQKAPHDRAARVGASIARGCQHLAQREREAAARCFEAALGLDPLNDRAGRELAALRRGSTDKSRGLLTKLLGRK